MILHGDCREVMATLEANSIDSIVTDPPYGLSFMGKGWDHGVPGVEFWTEALRVTKPGAHLLAFGGSRTYHRLACAIEDAGWEVRDCIMWIYGSGFPKSHNVSKAIDREAGAETSSDGYVSNGKNNTHGKGWGGGHKTKITAPSTEAAKQWAGWGSALKPAHEPIIVARKPLVGTIAQNVLQYGTGGINIDGCRVGIAEGDDKAWRNGDYTTTKAYFGGSDGKTYRKDKPQGRWPANVIHDGSDEVVAGFTVTKMRGNKTPTTRNAGSWFGAQGACGEIDAGDNGSTARFFYAAKASKADRDGSTHPTMKPTDLMRYLCRLVTPPGGTVLDPFCGSGSTGKGAILEGFSFIGIEREAEYVEIAKARTEWARKQYQPTLFDNG